MLIEWGHCHPVSPHSFQMFPLICHPSVGTLVFSETACICCQITQPHFKRCRRNAEEGCNFVHLFMSESSASNMTEPHLNMNPVVELSKSRGYIFVRTKECAFASKNIYYR